MSFVDSVEIERLTREIVDDAMENLGADPNSDPQGVEREVRERFLEQWHRFSRFGVESRSSLAGIVVKIRRRATRGGDEVSVSVDVRGTPLERKTLPS